MKNLLTTLIIGLLLVIGLSSCSYQPAINAAEKVALSNAEAANDNLLLVNTIVICSMSYRTFLRHPETWSWINQMCAPGVKEKTPNDLLTVPKDQVK